MSDHHKISPTAWLIAKYRSVYSEIPYCREIEIETSKKMKPVLMNLIYQIYNLIVKAKPEKVQALTVVESRYRCIDDALPKEDDYVLIEFAAGLSPRCINHALTGRFVIETDLPGIVDFKAEILNSIYEKGERPANHHLMSVNILNLDEFDKIGKLYQEHGGNKPLYIVHEGVLLYFSEEEKDTFRNHVASFLRKYAPGRGYWITTDLTPIREEANKKKDVSVLVGNMFMGLIGKLTKRRLDTFRNHEEIHAYLAKSDLVGEAQPNEHILKNLYSLKVIGLRPEDLSGVPGNYKAFVVQPKEQAK